MGRLSTDPLILCSQSVLWTLPMSSNLLESTSVLEAGLSSWHATFKSIMWQQRVAKALYECLAVRVGQRYMIRPQMAHERPSRARLASFRRGR